MEGSFIDEELRAHLTDCLFQARTLSGRLALLYVLVDHKSSPDRKVGWQLLRYLIRVLEQWARDHPNWKLLPVIVPLVFYHGAEEWRIPEAFCALLDAEEAWRPHLLDFRYTLLDLGRIEDPDLSRQPRLRAWLLATKYATRDGQQLAMKEVLAEALLEAGDDLYVIVRYMMESCRTYDEQALREIIRKVRPEEEHAMMSQYAQELFAKGRQEGRQEGEAVLFLRLLQRRFGPAPEWVRERVGQAAPETLETWSDRLLEAESLQAVFDQ